MKHTKMTKVNVRSARKRRSGVCRLRGLVGEMLGKTVGRRDSVSGDASRVDARSGVLLVEP